jgi:hypothetical protein
VGTEPRNVVDITGIDPIVRAARSQLIEEAIAGVEGLRLQDRAESAVLALLEGLRKP